MPTRQLVVLFAVVAAHAGALWLVQHGMVQRPMENLVPAEILVEWMPSPKPATEPALEQKVPTPHPVVKAPRTLPPKPEPLAAKPPTTEPLPLAAPASPTPEPSAHQAETAVVETAPSHASKAVATQTPATAPSAPAAPRIEPPSANAEYLNNPRPAYPSLSKRLGEEGNVMLRVRIEADGTASQAEIRTSSGYERLDQTALQTVLRWRYVPGKRNGVAEAMWFNIPINFVLE